MSGVVLLCLLGVLWVAIDCLIYALWPAVWRSLNGVEE